jgi:tetratricopeptide (TPR) repeat protein
MSFGDTRNLDEYEVGDVYRWIPGKAVRNGGRPDNGDLDGQGHTVCPACRKDSFVTGVIRKDRITGVEANMKEIPYIPSSESPDKPDWWEEQAREQIQLGNWTSAFDSYEEALSVALRPYGHEERLNLRVPADRATLRQSLQGHFDASTVETSRDLRHIGRLLNNIGFASRQRADWGYARHTYDLALMVHCELLDPDHPDAAIALYNSGRLFQMAGEFDAARDHLQQALTIWKRWIKAEGKEAAGHVPHLASCLYALGEIMAGSGALDEARRNFEQSLELRELALEPGHADIAENLASLGLLCAVQGDRAAASDRLRRALALFTPALGEGHSVVKHLQETLLSVEQGRAVRVWRPLR